MPTAVFASGSGTNLQAVIDAARERILPLDVRLVISNKRGAPALERSRAAGIDTALVEFVPAVETRDSYARRLAQKVQAAGARLVLLLGWMHVLAPEFLEAGFEGVLNLHPAYLPDDPAADEVVLPDGTLSPVFRGPAALRDALNAKVRMTGATLIQITSQVDRGPVLARETLQLAPHDDEQSALQRLHAVERIVVREGISAWLAQRGFR